MSSHKILGVAQSRWVWHGHLVSEEDIFHLIYEDEYLAGGPGSDGERARNFILAALDPDPNRRIISEHLYFYPWIADIT